MIGTNKFFILTRRAQFIIAVVIYCFFALVPNPQTYMPTHYSDYVLHATGNFLLVISCWLMIFHKGRPSLALAISIPFSVLVELSQGLTSSRTLDLRDIAANFAGILLGFVVCYGLQKIAERILPGLYSDKVINEGDWGG